MKKYTFEIKNQKILWFFPQLVDWLYEIRERKQIRSLEQNRLYWWYIIKFIVLQYKEAWHIHTKDYIHDLFKKCFLKKEREYSDFSKRYILKSWSTTNLNKKQFTEFINNIKIICEFGKLWEIKWLESLEPFIIPDINEEELLTWIDKII